jgi:ABC-type Na+ efflux pump permease subunit
MTKEDIYSKLEYNGKYDTKVKTNLRNMIKENKENIELYSLLLEIQNELETGKAKLSSNKVKKTTEEVVEDTSEEVKKEKKQYVKKEKKTNNTKKKKKKKKSSLTSIIGRIFIILMILLMIASSISTIFSYFS